MEREFDLVRIVKQLRNLKILLEHHKLLDPILKLKVENEDFNIIQIDTDSHGSSSSESFNDLEARRKSLVNDIMAG